MIFVTVGSSSEPFPRLIDALEALPVADLVVQHGPNAVPPGIGKAVPFLSFEEMLSEVDRATAVISHAGAGSIMCALRAGHTPIVVPRTSRYGETVDNHQMGLARELAGEGKVIVVWNVADLPQAVASLPARRTRPDASALPIHGAVKDALLGKDIRRAKPSRADRLRPRVAIMHQGFIPRYRVRFFELLSEQTDVDYVVVHGDPPSDIGHYATPGPFAFANLRVATYERRMAGRSFVYNAARPILKERFDGLVIGTHMLLVTNHLLLGTFKARRKPVLYWGHGYEQTYPSMKKRLARIVDHYLAYTSRGAESLVRSGLPSDRVTVVRNTLDMDSQSSLHGEMQSRDDGAIRAKLGLRPESVVLLYLGRIYAEKRVPELFEALRLIRASGSSSIEIEVVIVGDGPQSDELQAEASSMPGVHLTGEIQDQLAVAEYLRVAAAVVIPGAVGLSVNHAFAHGTPIITRADNAHGPEIEFVEHGRNGLIIDGDMDAFAAALGEFVASRSAQERLGRGALDTRDGLGLDEMVHAFHHAVVHALGLARG